MPLYIVGALLHAYDNEGCHRDKGLLETDK